MLLHGTVEALQPINAAPPNLREDMCGSHRKRPATEDEDDMMAANRAPDSPYGVFLSSLRSGRAKGALANDGNLGEPVLVFTGTKPPAPGAVQAGWGEPAKPKAGKKTAVKPSVKHKEAAAKDSAKDGGKDKDASPTGRADSGRRHPSQSRRSRRPSPRRPLAPSRSQASRPHRSMTSG